MNSITLRITLVVLSFLLATEFSFGVKAQEQGNDLKEELTPKEKIEQAYRAFHEGVVSDNEETRLQAMKKILPKEPDMVRLFGQKDGQKAWELIKPGLAEMLESNLEVKNQFESLGKLSEVIASDVRKDERDAEDIDFVPADIPVYRVVAVMGKRGRAGSSCYVILGDRVVFVRGLEEMKILLESTQDEDGLLNVSTKLR